MTLLDCLPKDSQGKPMAWIIANCIRCDREIMKIMSAEVKCVPILLCKDCYHKITTSF